MRIYTCAPTPPVPRPAWASAAGSRATTPPGPIRHSAIGRPMRSTNHRRSRGLLRHRSVCQHDRHYSPQGDRPELRSLSRLSKLGGPAHKISGGKVLSSRTRRSGNRAASLLRLAAVTVGRTDTALGAFYRRLSSRIGKAKAVTATARKVAVLFYNAVRHGMEYVDPGASSYETRYRTREVNNVHRRDKAFGFVLQPLGPKAGVAVS